MGIREDLLKLEKRFSDAYKKATGKGSDSKAIGFFKNLKDGDLYAYVKHFYSGDVKTGSKEGKKRREWYIRHGYSPLDFLNSRINELDLEDRLFAEELRPGDVVNRFDICAIAKDYNDQKGMYQSEDRLGRTIALCVSTPNNAKQYDDHWLVPSKTYFYNMQDEHDEVTGLSFKNRINKLLFIDFEESGLSEHPNIPIYLFVHNPTSDKTTFLFEGIYYVNSLPTLDAFEFVRSDLAITDELRLSKKQSLAKIIRKKGIALVGKRKIVHMHEFNPPSDHIAQLVENYVNLLTFKSRDDEKHNYIQKHKLDEKIGSMGETLALEFEKDFVSKNIPEKLNDVKLAADSMGYDIRSFRKLEEKIVEIHIEVKTTSNENPYSKFHMSSHEKWYMENNPNNYWLYRIYDIYSKNVQCVYIMGDVAKRIKMSPSDYSCVI